jgi:glycosyltransferase involved in cell wall biosynthesis
MISVILTTKGHLQDLTIPCVRSIKRTVGVPYELIGVDDGSVDNTIYYLNRVCHKAIYVPGLGPGNARNFGLREASGDYILFLDNDILCNTPGWLRFLVEECKRSRAGIISPIVENTVQAPGVSVDGIADVQHLPGATMLFPRSTFDTLGYLDPLLSYRGEDTDYCFRAILAGLRVCRTDRLVMSHKGGGSFNWRAHSKPLKHLRKKYRRYRKTLEIP